MLISQVRQVLLGQIGQRNAESTLYENMLLSVRRNYADMTLMDMTGDTDAQRLFQTRNPCPVCSPAKPGMSKSSRR